MQLTICNKERKRGGEGVVGEGEEKDLQLTHCTTIYFFCDEDSLATHSKLKAELKAEGCKLHSPAQHNHENALVSFLQPQPSLSSRKNKGGGEHRRDDDGEDHRVPPCTGRRVHALPGGSTCNQPRPRRTRKLYRNSCTVVG
ncbi:unnamed protein product [Triticum turgidum subsp. durum]|uniref:Uncharacterized protein n=1 Tax=Triticum turgidum subsp. durum TaxID=4567 RepID=A0A9R0U4W3_TRITD|nr:unnamed protein product [Triticum turgidum subsp. durum]